MAGSQLLLVVSVLSCTSTYSRLLGGRANSARSTLQSQRAAVLQADQPFYRTNNGSTTNSTSTFPPVPLRSSRLQKMVNFFESTTTEDSCYRKDASMYRFYCPSPEPMANGGDRYICIRKEQLCNHIPDCPAAEDEDMQLCMFYEAIQYELHALKSLMSTHLDDKIASRRSGPSTQSLPDY